MPDVAREPLVLLVEDEENVREPLGKILTLYGFEVITARTADEAYDTLRDTAR